MIKITPTADGSLTLFNEKIGEHYHSTHGALQESKHVFLEAGFKYLLAKEQQSQVSVFEVGFGTGLNFLLSYEEAEKQKVKLDYTAVEAFPLDMNLLQKTQYNQFVAEEIWGNFLKNYEVSLCDVKQLSTYCSLGIFHSRLEDFVSNQLFDIIYFDAFSVQHQPELWTDELIAKVCKLLKPDGILVTYAITGKLKRALKANGCAIEKLPGAPGKREMLRAIKKF